MLRVGHGTARQATFSTSASCPQRIDRIPKATELRSCCSPSGCGKTHETRRQSLQEPAGIASGQEKRSCCSGAAEPAPRAGPAQPGLREETRPPTAQQQAALCVAPGVVAAGGERRASRLRRAPGAAAEAVEDQRAEAPRPVFISFVVVVFLESKPWETPPKAPSEVASEWLT